MNVLKSMGRMFTSTIISSPSQPSDPVWHRARRGTVAQSVKMGLNGSFEKDVRGIIVAGLYVWFSLLTTKQRLLVVQIY
jgi:hypothetical protein